MTERSGNGPMGIAVCFLLAALIVGWLVAQVFAYLALVAAALVVGYWIWDLAKATAEFLRYGWAWAHGGSDKSEDMDDTALGQAVLEQLKKNRMKGTGNARETGSC